MKKTVGQKFMEDTQYGNLAPSGRKKGEPMPSLELPYRTGAKQIHLPVPDLLKERQVNFLELVELRTSVRNYRHALLQIEDLSYLLWCCQGVKAMSPEGTLRNVPSAGGRHAFETYALVHDVDGIVPGLYRFLALEHVLLEESTATDITEKIAAGFLYQKMVATSSVTFIWTAVAERMTWLYGDRGYRYLHLDAGHVCQNLYLAANTLNFGACAMAAFDDVSLNQALGIDGVEQFVIYGASVGK